MFYGCHIWSQEQLKLWLRSQRSKKGRISQNTDVTCDCVQICFRSSFFFFFLFFFFSQFASSSTCFIRFRPNLVWPLGESLQKLSTVWPQRSWTGHRGQKGQFKGKCYSSYMVHRILTKLGQNNQQASGYKSYQQFDPKGHVGVTGFKKVI